MILKAFNILTSIKIKILKNSIIKIVYYSFHSENTKLKIALVCNVHVCLKFRENEQGKTLLDKNACFWEV